MPVNMFLKVEGIKGEAKDEGYEDWVEVLAWSWGCSRNFDKETKEEYYNKQDISITKWYDRTSPIMAFSCSQNTIYPEVILEVNKGDGDKGNFLSYKMKNARVTSCSTGGSGGERRLTENITFEFEEIEWIYHLPKEFHTEEETFVSRSYSSKE
ncbi:Hcp family type VI secretion system effector [Candidatus Uabimicrobium amorphum]|uniref:Type VI secretion protein n=1 Tax=Uabimicrobium amorphum TaxID=2596890 RepID=A0A5S9F4W7_UABAM|nr:type VI secretion system tube protein Hcp [Candidatus Uabimicrobium amorphum]BBM85988.1 hypothetical protein UABAM_04374 [Candidatus Uabimicrobium amorphum]